MPADHGRDSTDVTELTDLTARAGGATRIQPVAPASRARADARAVLLDRTRRAVATACLVPSPDALGSVAELDAALDSPAARTGEPGLRALLLRQSLVARVMLAAEPRRSVPGAVPDPDTEVQLDELLELVAAHGLSLFGADAQMLRARRTLLAGDEEAALSAVATGLAHLEEPVLVDHAATVAEHRHNVACSRRLALGTLISLGLHDLADTLVERAEDPTSGYDRVRLGVSWGLRLERAGRPGGERLAEALALAGRLCHRAAGTQRPLLAAAGVLASPHRGPAATPEERRIARRGATALAAGNVVPSQHDRLVVELARARALERAGDDDAAVALLATRRACPPRGEGSLMLAVTRELARLRSRIATSGGPRHAAESALGDYVADLEAELWTLHRARALSLRTGLAHDRLRREHGQVTALALADPLTGLPNRRALDRHLEEVLGGGAASPAVAMIDVDRFKQINDSSSHARGDEVLRGVATALRSSLRGPDLVARYGGDEFVAVLPDTAVADAAAALGRARAAVAALPAAQGRPVTLSVGVVTARGGEGPEDVLARADAAMYAAKRAGGDAVRTHDGPAGGTGPVNRS